MLKNGSKISTKLFLIALMFLISSMITSVLVWLFESKYYKLFMENCWSSPTICLTILSLVLFAISIYSYHPMAEGFFASLRESLGMSNKRIESSKLHIFLSLCIFWLSVIVLYIIIVGAFITLFSHDTILFIEANAPPLAMVLVKHFSQLLPWDMFSLSIILLIVYMIIEYILLKYSSDCIPIRIILYHRFVLLGDFIAWLESGWRSIAVKFFDVLFATWIVQSLSRSIWKITDSESPLKIGYSEQIRIPADPTNGTIFNSLSGEYQNVSHQIYYSGPDFGMDILSSIFYLLWSHWMELVSIWLVLEALGYLWSSSSRLVIVNASTDKADGKEKDEKDGKKKEDPVGPNLADLLATKLDRIKEIYQAVDEKRPIQSTCGAGEPIDAAIKVDRLEEISLSSASEIRLGPFGIPASSVSALISHILMGPKITIGLYHRDDEEAKPEREKDDHHGKEKEKAKRVLIASLSGKMGSQRWIVECAEPLEEDQRSKERSIEDMMTEMAHRIHATYSSMQSEKPGEISWRALWNFNEGLRAYRDSLKTKKLQKYYLYRAEKKFIDALKEDSSFSQAHYNLGVVYAELDLPESAQECFSKAIDVDPDCWEAYYALGISVFRKAKDVQQSYKILNVDMENDKKERIAEDYKNVINLCERVLEIKSREESFFEKGFTIKARAYDLMGNAWARMACLHKENEDKVCGQSSNHDDKEAYNLDAMEKAKRCLEKSVNYAWMALIKESVVHETAEDEARIVTECTLDLAHVYLKLSEGSSDELRPMRVALMQAIYINPLDANLYYLLARFGEDEECLNFMKRVYGQIHLINPDSVRVKAYLNLIEYWRDNGYNWKSEPASWFKECEDCCDEETYASVFHFLANSVEKGNHIPAMRACFERRKLDADLVRVKSTKKEGLAPLREKEDKCTPQERLRVCLAICLLARHIAICSDCKTSLKEPLNKLYKVMKERGICNSLPAKDALINEFEFNWDETSESDKEQLKKFLKENYGIEETGTNYIKKISCNKICINAKEKIPSLNMDSKNIKVILKIGDVEIDDFNAREEGDKIKILMTIFNRIGYLFISGLIFMELAKIKAYEYINDVKNKTVIDLDLADICMEEIFADGNKYKNSDNSSESGLRAQSLIFLKCSQRCMLCVKQILDGFKKDYSDNFYKKEISYYYVEAGKAFLDMAEVSRSLDDDDGNYNKYAKKILEDAIEILKDDDQEVKLNKIRTHLAQAYLACRKLPNALKEGQIARNLNPLDYEERKVLGEIFCELKEYKNGLSELNTALSYKPNDSEILICIGKAYFSAGKDCKRKGEDRNQLLKNALERLEEALDIADRSEVRYRGKIRYWIGRILLEMGRYEKAIPHLRILAEKDERDLLPALYLGYAYLKCNSHEECERSLYKLIKNMNTVAPITFRWVGIAGKDEEQTIAFLNIAGKEGDILKSFVHSDDTIEKEIFDEFFGRQYEDERHISEILARAYIYLAYSYAERDANLCESWELAYKSQYFVNSLKEKRRFNEDRTRQGVLNGTMEMSCSEAYQDIIDGCSRQSTSIKKTSGGYSMHAMEIAVKSDPKDVLRKRKSKAHLAECAGTICYKMGELEAATEYLNISISLYPDAGAYLNLAKAYERIFLRGKVEGPRKDLIGRTILDLCSHAESLDIRDEHKRDLDYFRKRWPEKGEDPDRSAAVPKKPE